MVNDLFESRLKDFVAKHSKDALQHHELQPRGIVVMLVYKFQNQWQQHYMNVPFASTIRDLVMFSKRSDLIECVKTTQVKVGVYNRLVDLNYVLSDLDRVEFYEPIEMDPKVRRQKIVNQSRDPRKWRQKIKTASEKG